MYTTPFSTLISSSVVDHHMYADDTGLSISFVPQAFSVAVTQLQQTISSISSWMFSNRLALNPSKTEFMLIGLKQQLSKISNASLVLDSTPPILPSDSARNLGIIFDSHMSFSKQISTLTSACFYHIRDLRRIRHTLDHKTASIIATSLVHSKLDYCNSLYVNLPSKQISKLQILQNALARTVSKIPKYDHITPTLKSLHWLKIEQRIQYKIISITYSLLQSSHPSYLRGLILIQPNHSTRSSDHLTLSRLPITSRSPLKISDRSFRVAAPILWNSLPRSLRLCSTALTSGTMQSSPMLTLTRNQFLSRLKTHLYSRSYPP